MKIVILLAMHGMPPADFPQKETLDYFMLHSRLENMSESPPPQMQQQYVMEQTEKGIRNEREKPIQAAVRRHTQRGGPNHRIP